MYVEPSLHPMDQYNLIMVYDGQPWLLRGLAPPLAQGVILESRDRVLRRAPGMEPASPSSCVLSASIYVYHK